MRTEINSEPDFANIPNDWSDGQRWDGTEAAEGDFTKKLRVVDLPGVRDCNGTAIEYLREPELQKGAVVAFTGGSGDGKSTLVTAFARDVKVPVLFLDRENPRSVFADRLDRLDFHDGPRLRVWAGWCEQEAPLPDAPAVTDWVKACDAGALVVVDSLSGFHGGDQNDAGEMRTFMHRCRRLADLGATVVVIHHDGKAETAKDYRGSSDFKAAIDTGFHVSNYGDSGQLGTLVLRPFKMRVGSCGEITYSYAGGRFIRGNAAEVKQTLAEQLTALLRLNPGVTARRFDDLVNDRGLGRNRARTFLGDGVTSGAVRFEPGPKNAKRYFLAGMEATA